MTTPRYRLNRIVTDKSGASAETSKSNSILSGDSIFTMASGFPGQPQPDSQAMGGMRYNRGSILPGVGTMTRSTIPTPY